MVSPGNLIHLCGKTLKGKNRVREHGNEWEILFVREKVSFSSQPGPWLCVRPWGLDNHIRWVHIHQDIDFEVVVPNVSQ